MTCPRHPDAEPRLTWQTFTNDLRHIRATCPVCGSFLGYAPQTPANVEAANDSPEDGRPKQQTLF